MTRNCVSFGSSCPVMISWRLFLPLASTPSYILKHKTDHNKNSYSVAKTFSNARICSQNIGTNSKLLSFTAVWSTFCLKNLTSKGASNTSHSSKSAKVSSCSAEKTLGFALITCNKLKERITWLDIGAEQKCNVYCLLWYDLHP